MFITGLLQAEAMKHFAGDMITVIMKYLCVMNAILRAVQPVWGKCIHVL